MATNYLPRGRPRHNRYTYDAARRVRRRLADVQIAMRDLSWTLAECVEVSAFLEETSRSRWNEIVRQIVPPQRVIYQELAACLLPEAVKAGAAAEGQP